jgi:Ca2+:H+ antiporter
LAVFAGVANYDTWAPVPRFALATLALAGLAWVVSLATEQLGERLGPGATGLMQASLGNLPELFVVVFALQAGDIVVAQTAIIGSILANALLVLGLVIVIGARRTDDGVMRFSARLPRDTATLLLLAVFIIVLLGLSLGTHDRASHHVQEISAVGAVCLLVVYGAWVVPYVRSDFAAASAAGAAGAGAGVEAEAQASVAAGSAAGASVTAAAASTSAAGEDPGGPRLGLALAVALLTAAGAGSAFVSEWFVHALRPAIAVLNLSQAFAGLVIVALASNAVEHVTGLVLAYRRRFDLAISVVKNSVAQIAAFLFPLLVLISFALATQLTFAIVPALAPVYIGALVLTALIVAQVTGDGQAAEFEGWALVALYVILATLTLYE